MVGIAALNRAILVRPQVPQPLEILCEERAIEFLMSRALARDETENDPMYYFYIVRCSDNTLYCGQTNNLQKRIQEHNFDKSKSARYTKVRRPIKLVYFEQYETLQEAMKRELQVKRFSRNKKEALIK